MFHHLNTIESLIDFNEINNETIFINVINENIMKVKVGNFTICEIINKKLISLIKKIKNKIILYINTDIIFILKNRKNYEVLVNNKLINIWFCKSITLNDIDKDFIIKNPIQNINIPIIPIIYARCENSMNFLDKVHRKYIKKYKFKKNDIIAIKSVAGSGKTTTLLDLANINQKKKILYIAFNKCLIDEIKIKKKNNNINNLFPSTFDSLMRNIFMNECGFEPYIIDLKPQTISSIIPWFENKSYKAKQFYCYNYSDFCRQNEYNCMKEYCLNKFGCEKKMLIDLWTKTLHKEFYTFDSIRKLCLINNLCKKFLDKKYDIIFIDEAQDFDPIMLKILIRDTTIPKLFVGDPKQAIYEWRGCINAFDILPKKAKIFEFYSTFRIGNPACNLISKQFNDCWMISMSNSNTKLNYDIIPDDKYVYIFRSWKCLLNTAKNTKKIWIYNYHKQIDIIKKLHNKLKFAKLTENEKNNFSDDLPAFLMKLSANELESLIENINKNLVNKDDAYCQMYTIHSYKGMENNIIRIANDIDKKEEHNLYYVALTRGIKNIICDTKVINDDLKYKQSRICEFIKVDTECYQPKEINNNYLFGELEKINKNIIFESKTKCGQLIKISKVKNSGGKHDNKMRIYITGPLIIKKIKQKSKTIYCENNLEIAKKKSLEFINNLSVKNN